MPEVTPKWVRETALWDEMYCKPIGCTKVLTLDQIEAWLERQKYFYQAQARQGFDVRQSCETLTDLLAQVQAWKERK